VNRILGWRPARASQAQVLLIATAGALATVAAAYYVTDVGQGSFPKPLVVLVAAAGAVVLFNLAPETLFLGWLLAAPLLQSLPNNSWGHPMELALYFAPALALTVHAILRSGRQAQVAWFDFLPAAYMLLVFSSMALTTDLLWTHTSSTLKAVFETVALGPIVYYLVAFRVPGMSATRVLHVLLISCVLQGAMAIVEFLTKWNLWNDNSWHNAMNDVSRSVATLQNPAVLGGFIGAGLVVALTVLLWDGPVGLRRISFGALAIGVPGLAFTFTRGPILAVAIVGLLLVLLRGRARLAAVGVIAAAALALVIAWPRITHTAVYRDRVAQSSNVQTRLILQDWSIRLWKEKPILGWGYASFDRVKNSANFSAGSLPLAFGLNSTSHNTYLTVLVQYGAVGLLLMLAPFVVIVLRALRRARAPSPDRWLLIGVSAAVAVLSLAGTTFDYRFFSFVPALPWLLLGLLRRAIPPQDREFAS
jgi:O-antigen ligase